LKISSEGDDNIFIDSLRIGPEKNFCYLLICKLTGHSALIDPAFEFSKIVSWTLEKSKLLGFNKSKVSNLLATHWHGDHAGGLNSMKEFFPTAKTGAHASEIPQLKNMEIEVEVPLNDSLPLKIGNFDLRVMHSPGHSVGGCCYITANNLFSGDTLFIGQCGRTDLPGGSDAALFKSLQKIKELDPSILIRPGHDYGLYPYASLGDEMKTNPSLKAKSLADFIAIP
jgi:hydroxyacylglutathione hydrolase